MVWLVRGDVGVGKGTEFFTTAFTREDRSVTNSRCAANELSIWSRDISIDEDSVPNKKRDKVRNDKTPGADGIQPRYVYFIALSLHQIKSATVWPYFEVYKYCLKKNPYRHPFCKNRLLYKKKILNGKFLTSSSFGIKATWGRG